MVCYNRTDRLYASIPIKEQLLLYFINIQSLD